jgi:hypothetical protein
MTSSDGLSIHVTRKRPRRDYNALNNGIDSYFPPLLVEELDEASASNSSSSEPLSSDKPIPFDEPKVSDHSIPSDEILPSDDHYIADELLHLNQLHKWQGLLLLNRIQTSLLY